MPVISGSHHPERPQTPHHEDRHSFARLCQSHDTRPVGGVRRAKLEAFPKTFTDPVVMTGAVPFGAHSNHALHRNGDHSRELDHLKESWPLPTWSKDVFPPRTPSPIGKSRNCPGPRLNEVIHHNDEDDATAGSTKYWGTGNKGFKFPNLEDPFIDRGDSPGTVRRRNRTTRDTLEGTTLDSSDRATEEQSSDRHVGLTFDWAIDRKSVLSRVPENPPRGLREDNRPCSEYSYVGVNWIGASTEHISRTEFATTAIDLNGAHCNGQSSSPKVSLSPTSSQNQTEHHTHEETSQDPSSDETIWDPYTEHPVNRATNYEPIDIGNALFTEAAVMKAGSGLRNDQHGKKLRMRKEMMSIQAAAYQHGMEVEKLASEVKELSEKQHAMSDIETKAHKNEKRIWKLEKRVKMMVMLRDEAHYWPEEKGKAEEQETSANCEITLKLAVLLLGALSCFLLGMVCASRQSGVTVVVRHQGP